MQRQYKSHLVNIGSVSLGDSHPILLQSMTNTQTLSVQQTVDQCIRIIQAGSHLVRISARNKAELEAIDSIRKILRSKGIHTPLIADIHFSASLAVKAAACVEKVRINPGNFYSKHLSGNSNLDDIRRNLHPLIVQCTKNNTAIRIGTNHGSLSERITTLYGEGAEAMTEASMEFVRVIADYHFRNCILSVKASHAAENIKATRMLVSAMQKEGYTFPLHLGVTEAGLGFSGRIKSAVGIGALLADGIGNTIRVSLTEDPEHEIPVAKELSEMFQRSEPYSFSHNNQQDTSKPLQTLLHISTAGGCIVGRTKISYLPGLSPDITDEEIFARIPEILTIHITNYQHVDTQSCHAIIIETKGKNALNDFRKIFNHISSNGKNPLIIWKRSFEKNEPFLPLQLAAETGNVLSHGITDCIWPNPQENNQPEAIKVLFEVFQVLGKRISHADFISCPSCNRTSFNILSLAEEVRAQTFHLKELSIAVMGCIVNGPGEMGNANYGLVGQEKNALALYHKGKIVEQHIPINEAVKKLISLIQENGDWHE